MSGQAEGTSVLGLRWNFKCQLALEGWHLDFAAEHRRCQPDVYVNMQVIAVALEKVVRFYFYYQVKVASGAASLALAAFAGDAHPGAGLDPGRYLDFKTL